MTVDAVATPTSRTKAGKPASAQEQLVAAMVAQAQEQGLALTGPDGLLKQLTKTVLETALTAEITEHLGHAKHGDQPGREGTNVRNGTRTKTVISDAVGPVEVAVPRDREGTFEPVIVKKRQRRLGSVDEIVLSLYAKRRARFPRISPSFMVRRCRGRWFLGSLTVWWLRCRNGSRVRSMNATRPCSLMLWL